MPLEQLNEHEYLSLLTMIESAPLGLTLVLDPGLIETEHENGFRTFFPHDEGEGFYEIVFNDYIAYLVRNESFTDAGTPPTTRSNVETFHESTFLDFIRASTIQYPGQGQPSHYSFLCQEQIIDVASLEPPEVRIVPTATVG
jgi:hypothetical protein